MPLLGRHPPVPTAATAPRGAELLGGTAIDAQRDCGHVSHNDFLYCIDPFGRRRLRVILFANEGPSGVYSLPSSGEAAWAAGIAAEAEPWLQAGT